MQVAMSGLLGERVVCVVNVLGNGDFLPSPWGGAAFLSLLCVGQRFFFWGFGSSLFGSWEE